MEQKEKLQELNKESLEKLDAYLNSKKQSLNPEDHEKLHQAKEEWQKAWAKLMETLMVLERLEI
ncbi:MAG: hypothetical protein JST10_15430 [Bacteroidetes bacterium]|nr:hypothetical protein [Bacteroidota bacterium]MBS1633954.1 hypothetical protein [Bacteroidota bacterium]